MVLQEYMMSIIGLVLWEGMVFIIAKMAIEAISTSEETEGKVVASIVLTIVIIGLAILPFTGVF